MDTCGNIPRNLITIEIDQNFIRPSICRVTIRKYGFIIDLGLTQLRADGFVSYINLYSDEPCVIYAILSLHLHFNN